VENYAQGLSGGVNFVVNSPARALFTPMEMSMQAPFVDAATAIDPTSFGNTFISYYTWGSVIGLGLDLTLREKFNKPLDGFMRLMWQKYGVTEKPYTVDDLQATLAEYTGDAAFAKDFFAKYIRGHDVVDYKALLANAGFLLRPSNPGKAFLGLVQLDFSDSSATIESYTQKGSPLYDTGLDKDDRILSIGGHTLASDDDWQAIKTAGSPGATVDVAYVQRGERKTGRITFVEDPRIQVVTYEEAGMPVTEAMKIFRKNWIGEDSK
jgi:predicted metalloprotease with PDZ domain